MPLRFIVAYIFYKTGYYLLGKTQECLCEWHFYFVLDKEMLWNIRGHCQVAQVLRLKLGGRLV